MKSPEEKHVRLRALIVGIIFSLIFTIIGARAVYLQVFCGSWLSQKAANQYKKSLIFHGKRGTIYDAKYKEMAVSIDATSIAAYPQRIEDASTAAKALAKALKIDARMLCRKLSSNKSFVWIKRKATPKETKAVDHLKISGVDFIPEFNRFYPNRTLAAQVIGFSGIDNHGLEGIEFYYNTDLEGVTGKLKVLKDALGRGFEAEKKIVPNYSGNNLILTIDRTIQYITENALEEAVTKFSANSGMAIVMVPKTGAILALAHFPFFNPNIFNDFGKELWRNRIITDPFEPGSTMKVFSVAAAIESGVCTPNSIFFCENGEYKIGNNIIHDATHAYGWLSLQQIIKYSSNIGVTKVCEMVGPETFYKTLQGFGFGAKTGIDCPGETNGCLMPYKKWSDMDAGAISFGQGISVSALQLITATSSIANGGIIMKPYIVQAVTDHNGRLVKNFGPKKIRRVISARTANTMVMMMRSVVQEGGTGVEAALEGYSVCGKTGTAQKINEKGKYTKGKYTASFIGFVPADNPELSIIVVIDEPQRAHYGGIVAAPAFKKIALETLDYMDITPQEITDRLIVSRGNEATG